MGKLIENCLNYFVLYLIRLESKLVARHLQFPLTNFQLHLFLFFIGIVITVAPP